MSAQRKTLYTLLLAFCALPLALGGVASAQKSVPAASQAVDLVGIVPGDQLGWEINRYEARLLVSKPTQVELWLYSPGFDPKDYRSAMRGAQELGDERYDKGQGALSASYSFAYFQQGRVLARKTYGLESHRWERFYSGRLEPGEYIFLSSFQGFGKNAFRLRVASQDPGAITIALNPTLKLEDIRLTRNVWMQVHGFQEVYTLEVHDEKGLRVGIYDGDGPKELELRLKNPDGSLSVLPVSGDREWVYFQIERPGRYTILARPGLQAKQYSNTIGLQFGRWVQISPDGTLAVRDPGPVQVEVVDTAGHPLKASYTLEGDAVRVVTLGPLPDGYRFVRAEVSGGRVVGVGKAQVGFPGGTVRFVLQGLAKPEPTPAKGTLEIQAVLVLPGGEVPYDLNLRVGERAVQLGGGSAKLALAPGTYPLKPEVSGASVEGPKEVTLRPGEARSLTYRVRPEVTLSLAPHELTLQSGEEAAFTLSARTAFPDFLPADLELALPAGLEALSTPRLTAPLSANQSATLTVRVRARERGIFTPEARLSPWGLAQAAQVTVRQPAAFTLQLEALKPAAAVGEEATYRLTVRNAGDLAGETAVELTPPSGLEVRPQRAQAVEIRLGPGQSWSLEFGGRVTPEAADTLSATARLADGTESKAEIRVLRPRATLTRRLEFSEAVPGEELTVTLKVENQGLAPLTYTLTDTPPESVIPLENPRWQGRLEPGQTQTHTYRVRVAFGPEGVGLFRATLHSDGGDQAASDTLRRRLVGLEQVAEPGVVVAGGEATFKARLSNPLARPLTLTLRENPVAGLGLEASALELTLAPGEARELTFPARPNLLGALENQVSAWLGTTPAASPATASLRVKPRLEPIRLSQIELPFSLEGQGERLLITQRPPSGATYEPGSSRLDGLPLPDPKVDAEGRLFWELPVKPRGTLSYTLRHRDALGALEEPTLTLRTGEREVFLKGTLSFAQAEKARPWQAGERQGFIREPQPGTVFREERIRVILELPLGPNPELYVNGEAATAQSLGKAQYDESTRVQRLEFYGLPLKPGLNRIELSAGELHDQVEVFLAGAPVRLLVRPLKLLADGRSPLEFELLAQDALGLPSGFGPLTVAAAGAEPLEPDAFPAEAGYQVLLKDGRAVLRLKPLSTPGQVRLELAYNNLQSAAEFFVPGSQATLYQYQGSIGLRVGQTVEAFGHARGYFELPLGQGRLQGALDAALGFDQGHPQLNGGLDRQVDPTGRFPLLGSGQEAKPALRSDDPIALRYDDPHFSLGYYADGLSVPGVSNLPAATALRGETRGDLSLKGFAALLPGTTRTREILPDGTRIYSLGEPVLSGSEKVVLLEGQQETVLERLKDYTLDYPSGTLTLAKPLWPTTPDFQPVRLRVTYAPENAPRDRIGFGAGLEYKSGGWRFGLGLAQLERLLWGAQVGYEAEGYGLQARYSFDGKSHWGFEGRLRQGGLEGQASLGVEDRVQGSARVAATLGSGGKIALEHVGSQQNQTALLYEQPLNPAFTVGAGLAYTWESESLGALLRGRYEGEGVSLQLTHTQPFRLEAQAVSRLDARYPLGANLDAEAGVSYTWGGGFSGSLGLKQKLGGANLALSYQLPGASGEGNRARFGLEAPLPLDEKWSLNLNAGYERSLSTGADGSAFGLAARYQSGEFSATAGSEVAFQNGQAKLTLRGGATGSLDPRQTLSLDATYQVLPTPEGRFTLAYALRGSDVTLLTYHRLQSGTERTLEGEAALSYYPASSFQLRPSLAYRILPDDGAGNTYQLGLGATYYLGRSFGIGGALYRTFTPALGAATWAWGLEGSYRLLEELWVAAGYTFGGGLTVREGFYVRLDVLGGSR
ncbi:MULTISPECIES: DUF11 domain-containing protein [unclassified Meiothermus]|uniref:DUF11 domain-containing protein n=1 Tax=unclassified Meiothermus TaxID=370471 RepID=UPI000D7BB407|nr:MULTISPECIES: DUF11 domain-containing protein [unclassified Meiothermus]PZA08455.1 hypothetical protein DNA98_03460 [Meiothermus sp. Pnk-1]RYM39404.1 DUF11 domain-containing protein [Meiothermus sp. PNK-Is4]